MVATDKNKNKNSAATTPPACWQQQRDRPMGAAAAGECELDLVEHQAEVLQARLDEAAASSVELLHIFARVRAFLVKRRCVCYGGTAINNLLPAAEQFYGATDVPDYDAYSATAIQDAKDMVDELRAAGVSSVEAKSGVHVGTYKVFANFVAVLDLTEMPRDLFDCLQTTAIPDARDGLLYAHPMYLRVGVHVELSRPMGDVSRWSKVAQRLALLDKAYPLTDERENLRLDAALHAAQARYPLPLQQQQQPPLTAYAPPPLAIETTAAAVAALVSLGGAFAGELANRVYSAFDKQQSGGAPATYEPRHTPFADVLVPDLVAAAGKMAAVLGAAAPAAERATKSAMNKKETDAASEAASEAAASDRARVIVASTAGTQLLLFPPVLDLVPWRLEIVAADGQRLIAVYETNACYAYNEVSSSRALAAAGLLQRHQKQPPKKLLRLANMDSAVTLLCIMAFVPRCQRPDALHTARALLALFARHRADQHRPWARFQLPCLGEQHGLVEMRQAKIEALQEFKRRGVKSGAEYDRWFLKYAPADKSSSSSSSKKKPMATRKKMLVVRKSHQHHQHHHHRGSGSKRRRVSASTRRRDGGMQSFFAKLF
jgi:hypothetical protein